MKSLCKILTLGALFSIAVSAHAVKAKPGIIEISQPDGTILKAMLHGDETVHYATTPDSLLILPNETGIYEYAVAGSDGKPITSGISAIHSVSAVKGKPLKISDMEKFVAVSAEPSRLDVRQASTGEIRYRYSNSAFPTLGTPHSLVILVEYQDYRFHPENPREYFNDFLNGDNFTRDGGTGSCRQYYIQNSNGLFSPTFDVYGPVLLANNRKYYGGGTESKAPQMVVEAVAALDDEVDFSQYDHNNDGYVDSVYIIYADQGEANSGVAESVWPYSWELEEDGIHLLADGVKFNTYGVSNEIDGSKRMEGIGTFTHEFGHVLGLPDLYNTVSTNDSSTPWDWSVMDCGNYLNNSRTPCGFSSFERYSLGWLTPQEIVASDNYLLTPLHKSNQAFIMTTEENKNEFYIMDCRVNEGWDKYLPHHGLLIWHIDFVQRQWDANTVNNRSAHNYVDLIRADNKKSSRNLPGDAFPGTSNVTTFSSTSIPSLLSWNKKNLNVTSIHNIEETSEGIKFTATVTEERPSSVDTFIFPSDVSATPFLLSGRVLTANADCTIFDITGRTVGTPSQGASISLNPGLYIVNGHKILVK